MWRELLLAAILLIVGAIAYLGAPLFGDLVNQEIVTEGQDPGDLEGPGSLPSTISTTTVWRGSYLDFGFEGPTYLVIQTEEEWGKLWSRVAQDPPVVDWETQTVLVAIYGDAPNSGYAIEIEEVILEEAGAGSVKVRVDQAGPSCVTLQVITHPTHIVSVPKSEALFTFHTETIVHVCT